MKAMMKALTATVAVVMVTAAAGRVRAEDAKAPSTSQALLGALAEAGKPGPQHQKLQPFVGDWTFTLKFWADPNQPPVELQGTAARRWIMDGRFVQETVKGQCATTGKSFEGMGLWGYHNGEKKFSAVRACGLCGTISHSLITCDPSGAKFSCATEECCPVSGEKVKGRDEVIFQNHDQFVTNIYKVLNGKEVKVMEIVSVRKK